MFGRQGDSSVVLQNGFYVPLEVCARFIDGILYVPVRAVAEEFGIKIFLDNTTQTVYLGE